MDETVRATGLVKDFGSLRAVDGLSLHAAKGEVVGFLGPNGAGKTTTMRMITGYFLPDAGKVSVCGFDLDENPRKARDSLGYLPEGSPIYPDMTVRAFLAFVADIRGLSRQERKRRCGYVIDRLELAETLSRPIESLSKGFRRRVGLAQAILHDPPVLILDEPTDGLDPNQKTHVRDLIRELSASKSIIISTHILEEVETVCTRAVIIARGRIIADDTPEALLARSRYHGALSIRIAAEKIDELASRLRTLAPVGEVELVGGLGAQRTLILLPKVSGDDGTQALHRIFGEDGLLGGENWPISDVRAEVGRLNDVFRTLTSDPLSPQQGNLSKGSAPCTPSA